MYFPGLAEMAEMQQAMRDRVELLRQKQKLEDQIRQQRIRERQADDTNVQDAEWREVPAIETLR